jgi:hypothetical protein
MSISDLARARGIYLGRFTVRGSIMDFHPALTHSQYIAMGDLVYFMYVDDRLFKIGKAGGRRGFYGRFNQYKRGRNGDSTNCRIMDVMESFEKYEIEVYGILSPRRAIEQECPLTGKTFTFMVETHRELERSLTTRYLNEEPARDLPFCNQLN